MATYSQMQSREIETKQWPYIELWIFKYKEFDFRLLNIFPIYVFKICVLPAPYGRCRRRPH